jgi:hypothetical protein
MRSLSARKKDGSVRRNIHIFLVLGLVAGISFPALGYVPPVKLLRTIAIDSMYGTLHGLSYENGLLWTASQGDSSDWQMLGVSPSTGAVTSFIPTPSISDAEVPGGVTFTGGDFYASINDGSITCVNIADQTTQTIAAAGSGTPTGLAWDGAYLWQGTGGSANNLFRLDPSTGAILGTFTVPGGVQGVSWDGRDLWVSTVSSGGATYIYRYDRSGTMIDKFAAPAQLKHLGDLDSDGTNLWAVDSQSDNLYKLATPAPQVAAPAVPTGVLSVSYLAQTQVLYGGMNYSDSQSAASYAQLPVASNLQYGSVNLGQCALGTSRGYYSSSGRIIYSLDALAENNGTAPVSGSGEMTLTQQTVISSALAGRPNGTLVNASGRMTLTGSWEATRSDPTEDVTGMVSSLEVTLILLRPGQPSDTIFQGGIDLTGYGAIPANEYWGQSHGGGGWIFWGLDGQMAGEAGVKNAVAAGFSENPDGTLAKFSLSGVQIPYQLPVMVGQTFTIEVTMDTYAYVPDGVNGGAQVAMGQPPALQDSYLISSSSAPLPEPATISLLCLGALAAVRKRR